MKSIRQYALSAVAACVVGAGSLGAGPANAAVVQLGFILDSSGSIGSAGWTTIRNGLASAMDILLTGADEYEVTVVSFSQTATTVVTPTVVTSANIDSVKSLITGATFLNSTTNYQAAFNLMTSQLTGSSNFQDAAASYVNFATDGQPNVPASCTGGSTAAACGVLARNAMITAGIDNISIEGIGGGVDASFLQSSICYPQPCDTTTPFNFPDQGFYIGVANAQGYADAIGNKIRVVTGQVPEPASLALVGLALAGMGVARRAAKKG